MRRNIVHPRAGSLKYAIREIVEVAYRFRDRGIEISWENIGDPVGKGEPIAPWIHEIMRDVVDRDESWGYCHTAGVLATREFLANEINARGGVQITPDDILFFNGIGDAITTIYGFLGSEARVIGPTPAYSPHASAEAGHSDREHITYELDPDSGWQPDVDDIRAKVEADESIAGILMINPGNPTGGVHSREVLEQVVAIAREHDLFIICDEIYSRIVYNGHLPLHLSEVLGDDVCGLALRGISKEVPWPGSRCGWIEILNRGHDEMFDAYATSLLAAKRLEVCSTTAPQMAVPLILGDERYPAHLERRAKMFEERARQAHDVLSQVDGVRVVCPSGAFYLITLFDEDALRDDQTLPIDDPEIREMVEGLVAGVEKDTRFVYYLLAATGICVVPLSGFQCKRPGFRITLLECDAAKREWILGTLADAIRSYLAS
jgi:alanine-synthesizing transaminase